MNNSLYVRDLEPETKTALQSRAARNGRSMSAEARIILRDALVSQDKRVMNAAEFADRFFPSELRLDEKDARLLDAAVARIDGGLDVPDFD